MNETHWGGECQMDGVILAGGKSTRVGKDKALLRFGGNLLIELIFLNIKDLFERVVIVANPVNITRLNSLFYNQIKSRKVQVITDILPEKGPLGGIYSGLKASESDKVFVLACDMPFTNQKLIRYIVSQSEGYDVVVPHTYRGFEPLHAVYSKSALKVIEEHLRHNKLKVSSIFGKLKVRFIEECEIRKFDPNLMFLNNLNTKHELKKFAMQKSGFKIPASL
ncbi:MAG: molybdenum cofactor guanylyltransferase [Candidatus Hydrothermota bacterium]|nr:MAG: molybdenum cofactor guanylyltransferase [Candidatus Hydrothermae bacterium]